MDLHPLFEATMQYDSPGAWVYGDSAAVGYSEGSGVVTGCLAGSMKWSNRPSRKEDGIWESDLRGYIEMSDGAQVLFEARGRTMPESFQGAPRQLLGSMTFRACNSRFSWLDPLLVVLEGSFDPLQGEMRARGYVCVTGSQETVQVTEASGV